jgi:hypothetical protein
LANKKLDIEQYLKIIAVEEGKKIGKK